MVRDCQPKNLNVVEGRKDREEAVNAETERRTTRQSRSERPSEPRGGDNAIESVSFFKSSVTKGEMGHFGRVWVRCWVHNREFDKRGVESA